MSRYYLHIRDGTRFLEDFEGEDYPSLEAARADAVVSARQMMAERVRQGEVIDGQIIEIWDDKGVCVAKVVFREQLATNKTGG